jgi:hypothetical protein
VTINQLAPIYVTFSVRRASSSTSGRQRLTAPVGGRHRSTLSDARLAAVHEIAGVSTERARRSHVHRQRRRLDDGHDQAEGDVPESRSGGVAGPFRQVSMQAFDAAARHRRAIHRRQTSQQGQYVYVVKPDRTVELRRVSIDRQQGGETVIADGLKGGEEIVTEGQLRLAPGAHVTTGGRQATTS